VAEVPGRADRAAVQDAVADDAGADPGRHPHDDHVVGAGERVRVLAQRHQVDLVVHQHRHAEVGADVRGHVEAVPRGHDARVVGPARRGVDRAGQADADACGRHGGQARVLDQLPPGFRQARQDALGSLGDVQRESSRGQHVTGEVGDGDGGAGGADVGGQHGAGARVEHHPAAGPAARGHPGPAIGEEPRALQRVQPGSDRGTGEARLVRQFGPSARHSVEQQQQQLPWRCRWSPRYVRHGPQ
jgi:hypothetical protein